MTDRTTRSGRGWAYTGAVSGGVASIAANVAHSFIPPTTTGAPAGWAPEPGAVIGAIVWPVFLFIAVEILARIDWPTGPAWQLLRWAGLLPVAAVAALVSYRHLAGLLGHYGEERIVCVLGPLAVDGLMVMATGALLATSTRTHALSEPTTPSIPSAVDRRRVPAPIADTITAPSTADPTPAPPATPPAPAATEVPTPAQVAARITTGRPTATPTAAAAAAVSAAPTTRSTTTGPHTPAVRLAPSTTDIHVTASDAAQPTPPTVPADLLARARQVARQYRTEHGTPITPGQLAVRLKVTSEQATQALAVLDLDPNSPTTPIATVNGTRPRAAR